MKINYVKKRLDKIIKIMYNKLSLIQDNFKYINKERYNVKKN